MFIVINKTFQLMQRMSDRHASLLVCVCVMCFSVCVSVVSCRKVALTLASSCAMLSVFVHAHMHICV